MTDLMSLAAHVPSFDFDMSLLKQRFSELIFLVGGVRFVMLGDILHELVVIPGF